MGRGSAQISEQRRSWEQRKFCGRMYRPAPPPRPSILPWYVNESPVGSHIKRGRPRGSTLSSAAPRVTLSLSVCLLCVHPSLSLRAPPPSCESLGLHAAGFCLGSWPGFARPSAHSSWRGCRIPRTKAGWRRGGFLRGRMLGEGVSPSSKEQRHPLPFTRGGGQVCV